MRKISKDLENSIIKEYNNYIGVMELSKKYNVSRMTIQRYLLLNNIELRKKTSKIKVNNFSFSYYNSNSCYWAGFILADGYIRDNKRFTLHIKLQKRDYNHLLKFKKFLNFEGKIQERKNYFEINISSKQLIDDLKNNFEIFNKKSLTCYISTKIPKEYLSDYIRGYFDGDGCITYTSTHNITFVGTYKTIFFIRDFFNKKGVVLRTKEKPSIVNNKNIYIIAYSGLSAIKCLSILYDNALYYLDRKYELYSNIKNLNLI